MNNNNNSNTDNNGYYRNSMNPKDMNNNFDTSYDNKKSFMIYGTPAYDVYNENEINDKVNNNRTSMNTCNKSGNKDQNLKKKGILKNASKLKPRSTSLSNLVWKTDEDDEISSISSKDYDNNGKDMGYNSDSNSIASISTLVNNDKQYERSNNYRIQKAYSYSSFNTNRPYLDNNDQYNNIHHSYSCVSPNVNRQQINNELRRNSCRNSNCYNKNIIKIQSLYRGYKMRKIFSSIKHRKETVIDLLKNEIQYVKKLLCLYKVINNHITFICPIHNKYYNNIYCISYYLKIIFY